MHPYKTQSKRRRSNGNTENDQLKGDCKADRDRGTGNLLPQPAALFPKNGRLIRQRHAGTTWSTSEP